ncbi:hypothetical protein [Nocardia sp. NPDC051570]|uniref:hypothetical protein n=1 Tax=Nocardia sp. NPDC051570 TaxID=3364324 RepID=UPI0037900D11
MSVLSTRISVTALPSEYDGGTVEFGQYPTGDVDPYAHSTHLCHCEWCSYVDNDPAQCRCPDCIDDSDAITDDARDHFTDIARDMEFDL